MENLTIGIKFNSEMGDWHELKDLLFVPRKGDVIVVQDFFEAEYFRQDQWDYIIENQWQVSKVIWAKIDLNIIVEVMIECE